MDDQSIFLAALEKATIEERAEFLNNACGADHEMQRSVDMLLKAHEKAGRFLEVPPAGLQATAHLPRVTTQVGTTIGPYKLLE